jgi:hypothetical protein
MEPAGRGDPLVEAAEIGEARQEADHVDPIDGRRMDFDYLVWRQAVEARHLLEIDAVFAAVDDRHTPAPANGIARGQVLRFLVQEPDQGVIIGRHRIELDGEGAIGRHRFDQAGRGACPDNIVQRENHAVDVRIDRIAELDGHGAVAAGEYFRCRHDAPVDDPEQPEIPHLILLPIRQRGLDPMGHASEAGEGLATGSSFHASFC